MRNETSAAMQPSVYRQNQNQVEAWHLSLLQMDHRMNPQPLSTMTNSTTHCLNIANIALQRHMGPHSPPTLLEDYYNTMA